MESLSDKKIKEIQIKANNIRKNIISMLYEAGSGHTAGSLGMTDIFALLYFHVLKHDPKNPEWESRDRLVLSNGHICPALYATMAQAGYFSVEKLNTLRKFGSEFQGHPHREFLTSMETSSGPLGSGLSQAVGMAIADKIDLKKKYIYAILSDGEHNEGNTWEAIMLAAKYKLSNLIVIVDRNKIQIDGNTENIMPLVNLEDKYKSFNWFVQEVDARSLKEVNDAILIAKNSKGAPSVIIARTIPGKGVKAWENDYKWHGKAPNKKETEEALEELNKNYA